MFEIIYLVNILVNKTTTIANPYTNFKSMDLPHDNRPEHINSTIISLFFLPKNSDENVRNTYFVVVLVNRTITIRNSCTKFVFLNVSYATKLRWVNEINVGLFNGPQFINILEKTIETETKLGIISELLLCL